MLLPLPARCDYQFQASDVLKQTVATSRWHDSQKHAVQLVPEVWSVDCFISVWKST